MLKLIPISYTHVASPNRVVTWLPASIPWAINLNAGHICDDMQVHRVSPLDETTFGIPHSLYIW